MTKSVVANMQPKKEARGTDQRPAYHALFGSIREDSRALFRRASVFTSGTSAGSNP